MSDIQGSSKELAYPGEYPDRIYLNRSEDCENEGCWSLHPETTWCADKINSSDVEYVRADLVRAAHEPREGLWNPHGNDGMRHMESSDVTGGETDEPSAEWKAGYKHGAWASQPPSELPKDCLNDWDLENVRKEMLSRGWKPDSKGEPDCCDQASAMAEAAIRELQARRAAQPQLPALDMSGEPMGDPNPLDMGEAERDRLFAGMPFQGMEPNTDPLTHMEILSAVHHHASEIARLTVAVPVECSGQPPEALCPHGMPLADNVCGPCSEGRPNRRKQSPGDDTARLNWWFMNVLHDSEDDDSGSDIEYEARLCRTPDEFRAMIDAAMGSTPTKSAHPCTCHPDDNPPRPCPQKYALNECRAAAELCPHGMPLAENICGPCSEGRPNRAATETLEQRQRELPADAKGVLYGRMDELYRKDAPDETMSGTKPELPDETSVCAECRRDMNDHPTPSGAGYL